MIVQQSMGLIGLSRLLNQLRTSRDTLERRAQELGVVLHIRPSVRKQPSLAPDQQPPPDTVPVYNLQGGRTVVFDHGDNPLKADPDLLLRRLLDEHGDRRYESLTIKRGKT